MASGEQNITALPVKTNTGVANSDYFMGIDSAEGYQILIRDVAKYIMENYNGSTLAGQAQTPKAAIDALNSKGAWYELLGSKAENGNYTLNASYAEYKSVVIMLFGSGNSIASCIYPTTMLITAGYHPVVEVLSNKVEIEFTSATSVTVSGLVGSVRIYGIR